MTDLARKVETFDHNYESLSKPLKEALANCALEGIYPDADALKDLQLLDSGTLSTDEFIAFVFKKYQQYEKKN